MSIKLAAYTEDKTSVFVVHRLLFQALLEIREQGHETSSPLVYHLADLFHNVVLDLEAAAKGKKSYELVLEALNQKAQEKGLVDWLNKTTAEFLIGTPKENKAKFLCDEGKKCSCTPLTGCQEIPKDTI